LTSNTSFDLRKDSLLVRWVQGAAKDARGADLVLHQLRKSPMLWVEVLLEGPPKSPLVAKESVDRSWNDCTQSLNLSAS
jgi:hypothetical protein